MKKFAFPILGLTLLAPLATWAQDSANRTKPEELRIAHVHWARDAKPVKTGGSPDMTWHGGAIMTDVTVQSIFWGTSWVSNPGDKISGMDSWYEGFGGSNYAATSNEYTGTNGQVTSAVTFSGHFVDTTPATGGQRVSPILAEVCKMIPNPMPNGYYPVYTDIPRGHAGYCAWHSYGSCVSTPVQIAFFFKLDGDAGCDPQSSVPNESQGLAAIANVSGHELSEARSDPRNGGWYDSSGAENGDKCSWTFDVPSVTFKNGTSWKIQGEWSNNAYNSNTGYPNNSGQNGCLSGK